MINYCFIHVDSTTGDDPAPTGLLSINNQLFDDYNEESDHDWASGQEDDSDSEGSLLIDHPAFTMDDESLGDVDVDGPEDESQYQRGKERNWIYLSGYAN